MKLATCLLFACSLFGQTNIKLSQVAAPAKNTPVLAIVDGNGRMNIAYIGNGLTVTLTADNAYFLSCTYASGSIPKRVTLKLDGQTAKLEGMPRYIDVYRNGLLLSPEDGDYKIQQAGGTTTITFTGQQIDASDVIRAVYWQ